MLAETMPYAPPARIFKAITLADLLDAAGICASDASTLHPGEWRLLAQAARGNRIPSPETRELVLIFLRRREAVRLQFITQQERKNNGNH